MNIGGIYGGLHISPFEEWDPDKDDLVLALPKYGAHSIGANHCTGYITVGKMIEAGLPVVGGRALLKTRKDWYLGNSDQFGLPHDIVEVPLNLRYYGTRVKVIGFKAQQKRLDEVDSLLLKKNVHTDDRKNFIDFLKGDNPLKVQTEFTATQFEMGDL